MKLFVAFILLSIGGFVTSSYFKSQNNDINSVLVSKIPKCKDGDIACISHTFTRFFQNSDEYPELNMPKFAPFIPTKPFDSVIMHSHSDIGLGIGFDGHASNITVHGFDQLIIQNIEDFGKNPQSINFKWNVFLPVLRFRSEVFTTNMHLYSNLTSSIDFVMNFAATSVLLAVNMDNGIIVKNGKEHLKVNGVKVKILDINYSIDLYSKSLSPFGNGIAKSVVNYFVIIHSDIESYAASLIGSLVELIVDKLAIRDVFL